MRDPNRIDGYLERLGKIWKESPDLRFGQLVGNLLGEVWYETKQDYFYIEDEKLFDQMEEAWRKLRPH